MTRHHLIHVYTGLRAEIERRSHLVLPIDAGASFAENSNIPSDFLTEPSKTIRELGGNTSTSINHIH